MELAFTIGYLLPTLTGLILAGLAWLAPPRKGIGGPIAFGMLSITCWIAPEFVWMVTDGAVQRWAVLLQPTGIVLAATGFLTISRVMSEPNWRPDLRLFLDLLGPLAALVMGLTNGTHHLLVTSFTPDGTGGARWTVGPLFWVVVALSFSYAVRGALNLWRMRHAAAVQWRQIRTVLAGAGIALGTGGASCAQALVRGGSGTDRFDFTAIGIAVTLAVSACALYSQGLGRILPVARGLVFAELADAVLVLDNDDVVVDLNPAAERLFVGRQARQRTFVGLDAASLLGPPPGHEVTTWQDRIQVPGGSVDLDIRASPVRSRREVVGRVLVLRDVTEENARRRELAGVTDRLRQQVQTIDSLRRHLAELAVRDPLTGLHNRRHLELTLTTMAETHTFDDGPFCVAFIDLDNFKSVNDEFGHGAGDLLLVEIARQLRQVTGPQDTVARYGGEEFLVLLPATTKQAGHRQAREWLDLCRHTVITPHPGQQALVSRTISVGLACFPEDGTTYQAIVAAADAALYEAKRGGRNRVVQAPRRAVQPVPALEPTTPEGAS